MEFPQAIHVDWAVVYPERMWDRCHASYALGVESQLVERVEHIVHCPYHTFCRVSSEPEYPKTLASGSVPTLRSVTASTATGSRSKSKAAAEMDTLLGTVQLNANRQQFKVHDF